MPRRQYDRIDRVATYRVKVTMYPNGRKHRLLVPANSAQEAENRVRKRYPSSGGYHFQTTRVADYWREARD